MPEYLAPGVYVEETSFRPKTIEGVSTSTAGFVGPTRFGPTTGEPDLITSFNEFERFYGGLDQLDFGGDIRPNFLAQGVRAFFEEGGRRCYVARAAADDAVEAATQPVSPPEPISLRARFPGVAGNMRVTFTGVLGPNVLRVNPLTSVQEVQGVRPGDLVALSNRDSGSPPNPGLRDFVSYHLVQRVDDANVLVDDAGATLDLSGLNLDPNQDHAQIQVLTVDVVIERPIIRPLQPDVLYDSPDLFGSFSLDPSDRRSLAAYFTVTPLSKRLQMSVPFAITFAGPATAFDYADELFPDPFGSITVVMFLEGGTDGSAPPADAYRGESGDGSSAPEDKSGLGALEAIEDISIVAAPGYSFGYTTSTDPGQIRAIQQHLIAHAEKMRYRIAVLDAPDTASLSEVREFRGQIDSKYAALYYPWVTIINPVDGQELNVPPSGNVAGIYARNDVDRGVQKAPANEIVRLAVSFETLLSKAQQEVLNPEGINCFRFFEGRGYRLWGARTVTSDGEWKYVNLRRFFAYLERSIDEGTQVFVFESNGERLWDNVRRTVEDFLLNEWKSGRLMGVTPEEAFFVRCDRTTMTQNDIDNGRLICLIGVAPLRPAEFVIFRIGQKLLDTRG